MDPNFQKMKLTGNITVIGKSVTPIQPKKLLTEFIQFKQQTGQNNIITFLVKNGLFPTISVPENNGISKSNITIKINTLAKEFYSIEINGQKDFPLFNFKKFKTAFQQLSKHFGQNIYEWTEIILKGMLFFKISNIFLETNSILFEPTQLGVFNLGTKSVEGKEITPQGKLIICTQDIIEIASLLLQKINDETINFFWITIG